MKHFFSTAFFVLIVSFPTKQAGPGPEDIVINEENATDLPAITDIRPMIPPQPVPPNSNVTTTPSPNTTTTTTTTTTTLPPNITTTTPATTLPPNITTSQPTTAPPTSSVPPNTTTVPSSTIGPITTTVKPDHERRFDGPSFIGGIVLALGLVAIGFVAFKFYKARTELNYHTL